MTAQEVLAELKKLGSEQTKKTFLRHGAQEPFFGVKVADLKGSRRRSRRTTRSRWNSTTPATPTRCTSPG